MIQALRIARDAGFKTGLVTIYYMATTVEDAELWLKPLADIGVSDLSVSDDAFHHGDEEESPAKRALAAAQRYSMAWMMSRINSKFGKAATIRSSFLS